MPQEHRGLHLSPGSRLNCSAQSQVPTSPWTEEVIIGAHRPRRLPEDVSKNT